MEPYLLSEPLPEGGRDIKHATLTVLQGGERGPILGWRVSWLELVVAQECVSIPAMTEDIPSFTWGNKHGVYSKDGREWEDAEALKKLHSKDPIPYRFRDLQMVSMSTTHHHPLRVFRRRYRASHLETCLVA